MSEKAGFTSEGTHGFAVWEGISTAFSWLTILPIRGASVFDRTTGARAMAATPLVGVLLGVVGYGLSCFVSNPLLAAMLIVVSCQVVTRMMHLDGLADVGDAFGSLQRGCRAQKILADPHTGAHGIGAVILTLLAQFVGLAVVVEAGRNYVVLLVPIIARAAALVLCTPVFRAFSDTGFGALVIGTVHWGWVAAWGVAAGLGAIYLVGAPGVALVGTALLLVYALGRQFTRRFEGLNGDCIGASIEVCTAASVVLAALMVG